MIDHVVTNLRGLRALYSDRMRSLDQIETSLQSVRFSSIDDAIQATSLLATSDADNAGYVIECNRDKFGKVTDLGSSNAESPLSSDAYKSTLVCDGDRKASSGLLVVYGVFGETFKGLIPVKYGMRNKTASEQICTLSRLYEYSGMDFKLEILLNHEAVFANYLFWREASFAQLDVRSISKEILLGAICRVWHGAFPELRLAPLPTSENRKHGR